MRPEASGPLRPNNRHSGALAFWVMTGVVIFIIIMVVGIPMAVMFGGAIWSAVFGMFTENDADDRAEGTPYSLDS